jgi:hypothetical protein
VIGDLGRFEVLQYGTLRFCLYLDIVMIQWLEVNIPKNNEFEQLAKGTVAKLDEGWVLDLTLSDRVGILALEKELSMITDAYAPSGRVFSQILASGKSSKALFAWGNGEESGMKGFDLGRYPWLNNSCLLMAALSSPSDSRSNVPSLLSIIPAIRRIYSIPRFFHRESHTELGQLQHESTLPRIYKLTMDVGIRSSCEDVNVNLVPRSKLLNSAGGVADEYLHLFQQKWIDFSGPSGCRPPLPSEISEDMLPFPETKRDLKPGHAFVWRDDLFFHSVYLRSRSTLRGLHARPRSVMIVNQFDGRR